jgi:hypothetical protein
MKASSQGITPDYFFWHTTFLTMLTSGPPGDSHENHPEDKYTLVGPSKFHRGHNSAKYA